MILASYHQLDAAFVFAPAARRFLAHFAAVRIHPDRSIKDGGVAQRVFRVVTGSRDGAPADHCLALAIAASALFHKSCVGR